MVNFQNDLSIYIDSRLIVNKLKNHLAFYPGKVDCYLDGEKVAPQPGGFYGGWMTTKICGPVKGSPGTEWW